MLKALVTIAVLLVTVTDPVQGEQQNVDGWFSKVTVHVQNDLGPGIVLYLHCRSKDNDLGLHVLQNKNFQEWSFRDNFGFTTLFWCNLQWNNQHHSFEIYSSKKDHLVCHADCRRTIRPDGAYFYVVNGEYWEKRYSW